MSAWQNKKPALYKQRQISNDECEEENANNSYHSKGGNIPNT